MFELNTRLRIVINIRQMKITLTVVKVSRDTGKNPPAVKQHGRLALIITIMRSLQIRLPWGVESLQDHCARKAASATAWLSCIRSSHVRVIMKIWVNVPLLCTMKIIRRVNDPTAYDIRKSCLFMLNKENSVRMKVKIQIQT